MSDDPKIAGMGMLDLVEEVQRVREERDTYKRGFDAASRHALALRKAIEKHQEVAVTICGPMPHEEELWAALEDKTR